MNIILCGYRPWALSAMKNLDDRLLQIHDNETLLKILNERSSSEIDIAFLIGWSWLIPADLCEKHFIVGFHPSDLPAYAGGSPLQHQIIDGITKSQMSLFRITKRIDSGTVYLKEPINLDGNMTNIFYELERSSRILIEKFMKIWPNIEEISCEKVKPLKRLKAEHSVLTKEQISSMTARQLYDFCRSKEDPYPNACISDETGTVYFNQVRWKSHS